MTRKQTMPAGRTKGIANESPESNLLPLDPAQVTVDDLLNFIAERGRSDIPQDLMDQVFSQAYAFDISEVAKIDREGSPEAVARRLAVDTVAQQFADASSRSEVAAIIRSHPAEIARDGLWRAIHHDHEQIAAHEVGTMRLRDHTDMLRSVTRTGGSHLDADIPF